MSYPKYPLPELIKKMEPEEANVARRICDDYREVIESIPGSFTKHQAWEGGYVSHIEEAMNIGLVIHESLSACRQVGASLSDVLFCIFLHDFDKVQRYRVENGKFVAKAKYSSDYIFRTVELLKAKYGYIMTLEQINALQYAHGEGSDYHPTERIMLPLATMVHCADVLSARLWFGNGKISDSWDDN